MDVLANRRPENQGVNGVDPRLKAGEEEMKRPRLRRRQEKKRGDSSFLCLLFCSVLPRIGWCPPTWGMVIDFIESTDLNANLI